MAVTKSVIFIVGIFLTVNNVVRASESSSNSVELTFYRLQTSDWTSNNMEIEVHKLLASGATSYCKSNPSDCSMTSCCATDFKEGDIGKVSGYPENDLKDMLYKFYINLPPGSNIDNSSSLKEVLSSSTVIKIVENKRIDIYNAIGYYITWADDTFFGIPPSKTENIAIIIVAFVVLLLVIITAIALHFWNKRREHKEKLQKKIDDRKNNRKLKAEEPKSSQTSQATTYNVSSEIKPAKLPDSKIKEQNDNGIDAMYKDSALRTPRKSDGASNVKGVTSDTDSAIKMDDPRHSNSELDREYGAGQQAGSLPPLRTKAPAAEDTFADDERRARRERKKKKKEKRKRKEQQSSFSNEGYVGKDMATEL